MTIHEAYNEDLSLDGLEPGDDNPLDHEPDYNPLRYCYPMVAHCHDGLGETIEYELAVKFQLQMHGETTPIDFVNPKTNKPHTVDFFPVVPEIGLEPEVGPKPDLIHGYQIGENPYYLVPLVCRCKHIEDGRLLSREAARQLIDPDVLQDAITRYLAQIEQDPDAPRALVDLLTMWDPNHCDFSGDGDDGWDDEDDESWDSDDED